MPQMRLDRHTPTEDKNPGATRRHQTDQKLSEVRPRVDAHEQLRSACGHTRSGVLGHSERASIGASSGTRGVRGHDGRVHHDPEGAADVLDLVDLQLVVDILPKTRLILQNPGHANSLPDLMAWTKASCDTVGKTSVSNLGSSNALQWPISAVAVAFTTSSFRRLCKASGAAQHPKLTLDSCSILHKKTTAEIKSWVDRLNNLPKPGCMSFSFSELIRSRVPETEIHTSGPNQNP